MERPNYTPNLNNQEDPGENPEEFHDKSVSDIFEVLLQPGRNNDTDE